SPFPHGTSSLSVVYVYLALRSGLRRFTPAFTVPALLGNIDRRSRTFRVRGHYPLRRVVPDASATQRFCNSVVVLVHHPSSPTTPQWQRHQALTPLRFGLIP